jgi:hypothetical protein
VRTCAAILAAVALVGAAPVQKSHSSRKQVVIAVARDETVTITLDGKRITCEELNALFAKTTRPPHRHAFDCKMFNGGREPRVGSKPH